MSAPSEKNRLVAVEMPVTLIERLDNAVEHARRAAPHQPVSRSAVIRHFVVSGLSAMDEELARKK